MDYILQSISGKTLDEKLNKLNVTKHRIEKNSAKTAQLRKSSPR
jgi:hypothetical protein